MGSQHHLQGSGSGFFRKRIYKTRDIANTKIFDYIEQFYNRQRRHNHLGGMSPEGFEAAAQRSRKYPG